MQINTCSIIINFFKLNGDTSISIQRLQKMLINLYVQLSNNQDILLHNEMYFDINFEDIKKSVMYYNHLLTFDYESDMILLQKAVDIDRILNQFFLSSEIIDMMQLLE